MLRRATIHDAEEIHSIMSLVYDNLENKDLYVCDDLNYVRSTLSTNGFGVVACDNSGKIIASFIFRYPGSSEDNLGNDIGLCASKLSKVVHMETAVVLPEHRGNGLQGKMLSYAESLINTSEYKYFMATVSPDNPASYRSFENNGYKLIKTKPKYGGLMRHIYLKEVH